MAGPILKRLFAWLRSINELVSHTGFRGGRKGVTFCGGNLSAHLSPTGTNKTVLPRFGGRLARFVTHGIWCFLSSHSSSLGTRKECMKHAFQSIMFSPSGIHRLFTIQDVVLERSDRLSDFFVNNSILADLPIDTRSYLVVSNFFKNGCFAESTEDLLKKYGVKGIIPLPAEHPVKMAGQSARMGFPTARRSRFTTRHWNTGKRVPDEGAAKCAAK